MYYVYGLIDPINKVPFYIGKGKEKRASYHVKGYDRVNKAKCNTIENIRILGYEPEIYIFIENIDDENYAYDLEYSLIKRFYNAGIKLTNRIGVDLRPTGMKDRKHSKEAKCRIGLSLKGLKKPPRTKEHANRIAKTYLVSWPDGHTETIHNLSEFCRQNDLNYSGLGQTLWGKAKQHKGFTLNQHENLKSYK